LARLLEVLGLRPEEFFVVVVAVDGLAAAQLASGTGSGTNSRSIDEVIESLRSTLLARQGTVLDEFLGAARVRLRGSQKGGGRRSSWSRFAAVTQGSSGVSELL
jgi:hypothetical protein